jgi:hypothetical protein
MRIAKSFKPEFQFLHVVFGIRRFYRSAGYFHRKIHKVKILICIFLILWANNSFAWVFPEHRQILLNAIQNLDPSYRLLMDQLWTEATKGFNNRLTDSVIIPDQGTHATKIDYATWAAIAGDHSCSPEAMLNTILYSEWIIKVANIAEELRIGLATAKNRSQQINALRDSDIKLQRADLEYATRAGSNNVHFLLARPKSDTDGKQYLRACLSSGSPLNALGAYAWFHTSAILKAARYAGGNLNAEEKSKLMLSALADEAFGLHFLEDVFASGHVAGTWGDASVRKGTHDYYNERGLEVVAWDGTRMILKGDAFMREEDAIRAAAVVQLSLKQFMDAASGKFKIDYKEDIIASRDLPDSFNVCSNNYMPVRKADITFMIAVLSKTPVPGLATGLGELPRFRSELGSFIGVSTSLDAADITGGFGADQKHNGFVGGIQANIRYGFGLEGVLNQSGDGLVFIQGGWRLDGSSTTQINNTIASGNSNSITAVIPGRSALNLRIRLPFYLLPGDLIFAAPFVYLFSHKSAASMAIAAANGGLIPWQSGIATSIGRFQFILGREVGVSFYGLSATNPTIVIPTDAGKPTVVAYKSTQLDFPFLEYLPFNRSFSQEQSSSLLIQFTVGVDIPTSANVISDPGLPVPPLPELKSVWQVGMRVVFDWRHYIE